MSKCHAINLCQLWWEANYKAHIVPAGIGRLIRAKGSGNLKITRGRTEPTQLGIFDKNILCEACDNCLGKYDDYAIRHIRKFRQNCTRKPGNQFIHPSIDCERFSMFLLSVVWRASKSQRPALLPFSLGEFEQQIGDVIFGREKLDRLDKVNIFLCLYKLRFPALKLLYSLPNFEIDEGALIVWFTMPGIGIRIYFGDHSDLKSTDNISFNRSKIMRGVYREFENTADGQELLSLFRGD